MARPIGYQIRHRTLRSCVAAVEVGWRELPSTSTYGVGGRCPTCLVVHTVKTYHLYVDDAGRTCVSVKVFDNLCRAGAIDGVPDDQIMHPDGKRQWKELTGPPFEFVETIEPPPLNIGLGGAPHGVVVDGEGKVLYQPLMRIINLHEDYS